VKNPDRQNQKQKILKGENKMAKSVKKAMVIEPVSETVKEYRNDVDHYFKFFLMKQNEKIRQSSKYQGIPVLITDYNDCLSALLTEKICKKVNAEIAVKKIEKMIENRTHKQNQIDHAHVMAIAMNEFVKVGFTVNQAEIAITVNMPAMSKQETKTEVKTKTENGLDHNKIFDCLTGKITRKELNDNEKSEYGKLKGYHKLLTEKHDSESQWSKLGFTGCYESDIETAKQVIEQNGKNYQWYKQSIQKYYNWFVAGK
jgi:hypothetical protein